MFSIVVARGTVPVLKLAKFQGKCSCQSVNLLTRHDFQDLARLTSINEDLSLQPLKNGGGVLLHNVGRSNLKKPFSVWMIDTSNILTTICHLLFRVMKSKSRIFAKRRCRRLWPCYLPASTLVFWVWLLCAKRDTLASEKSFRLFAMLIRHASRKMLLGRGRSQASFSKETEGLLPNTTFELELVEKTTTGGSRFQETTCRLQVSQHVVYSISTVQVAR